MKKRFLSIFVSFLFVFLQPFSAFAQEPEAEEVSRIASFLEEYGIIQHCLKNRKNQELKPLTKIIASCITLRVYDPEKPNFTNSWKRAKKLKLVSQEDAQGHRMIAKEYLDFLFQSAGVTISPLVEEQYHDRLKKLRFVVSPQELHVVATAIDYGLIKDPISAQEASQLKKKLRAPLTTTQGLAYLYQLTKNQLEGTTIVITPFEESTPLGSEDQVLLENLLREVVKIIKNQSYYSQKFDEKKAMHEALRTIVKSIKGEDKYIEYYDEEEFKDFSTGLSGNLEGIGAYIEFKDEQILIVSPIEGSPAAKAGLQPEDIITKINGESTEGMTLQEAVNKIRGPKGTSVTLTIKRKNQTLEVPIVREKISVPALTISNRDGFEILKLSQFSSQASTEMLEALKKLSASPPRGIIIDLRNNPGGFLNEVVTISDFFVAKGEPLVVLKDRENEFPIKATLDPVIKNIPISILINKGSASASEILAGILQAYGIGKIYGETSFGKGTVQSVITLRDPGLPSPAGFKLTTSEYLIGVPNNGIPKSINGIGVKPSDNPDGPNSALVDDKDTPTDEALEKVLEIMSR